MRSFCNVLLLPVQVCWHKFQVYFEIEPRYVPVTVDMPVMTPETARKYIDENTIGEQWHLSSATPHASTGAACLALHSLWRFCPVEMWGCLADCRACHNGWEHVQWTI